MSRIEYPVLVTLLLLVWSPVATAQTGEWRAYSADAAGTSVAANVATPLPRPRWCAGLAWIMYACAPVQ